MKKINMLKWGIASLTECDVNTWLKVCSLTPKVDDDVDALLSIELLSSSFEE